MKKNKWVCVIYCTVMFFLLASEYTFAMHIMEGFLSIEWTIFWWGISLPFLWLGMRKLKRQVEENPSVKVNLAIIAAFIFMLSALKLPSITGSTSHPTGVGLGAIMMGPYAMVVISFIVLLFQAVLLAHGGITTLGANGFAMGVMGPIVSYLIYHQLKKLSVPLWIRVFLAASIGNMATYIITAIQLALAYPDASTGFQGAFIKFMGVFSITQIPLAMIEGLLTVMIFNLMLQHGRIQMVEGVNE